MCIFSKPVKSVSNTNLFARLTPNGNQFLVYQMRFRTDEYNAMILPLPVALPSREDSTRFISLKNYNEFFDDLDDGFPRRKRKDLADDIDSARSGSAGTLTVHDVGDFVASFVPGMDDFSRLDPQFVIPQTTWSKIPQYSDFGFAVFQLKSLSGKPHPMAFEFETRWPERVCFPTVHIHDGKVHARERFDHTLYLQHPYFDNVCRKYVNFDVKDNATGFVRSVKKAKGFCKTQLTQRMVEPDSLVHRLPMRGRRLNRDVVIDFEGKRPSIINPMISAVRDNWLALPAAVVATGLAWILHRRSKLKGSSKEATSHRPEDPRE